MGLLATAGMVSGMGQGIERGLQSLQTGLIQQGLQEDRFKHEAVVRESEHTFQSEKLRDQMAHAERLQKQTLDATHVEGEATREMHKGEGKATRDQQAEIEGWRSMEREGDRVDKNVLEEKKLNQTDALKGRELDIAEKAEKAKAGYYDAYRQYLQGGKGRASSAAKIDMETKKAGAAFYSSRITPLEKELIDPLTPPDRKKELGDRIEELSKEGLSILGIPFGKEKGENPQARLESGDPFAGSSPLDRSSRKAPAPAASAPTTPRQKPSNVVREGQAELQQVKAALEEAKRSGNAAVIAPLQKKYDDLSARWGQPGLLDEAGAH